MHLPIKVKSPNDISKWHMGINSAFKRVNKVNYNGDKETLLFKVNLLKAE
jgi:hypothetical protein